MKKKQTLKSLPLLLLVFSSISYATEPMSVAEYLKPYRHQLAQTIYTYHYATRTAVKVPLKGALDLGSPELQNHVRDWANYYWDISQPGGTGMIRGLYLATDPLVSRDFGKDNWLLYRVELRQGLNYLDLHAIDEGKLDSIPQEIITMLKANGCDETRWHNLIYKSFTPACRAIALKTLKDLDVDLIDYSWVSADYPPCISRPSDTFILLRPENIASSSVRVFYSEMLEDNDSDLLEQQYLEGFFSRVRPNISESGSTAPETSPNDFKLWPSLDVKVTDADFNNYVARHILGCRP